jgi:hypothetical protein
MKGIMDVGGLTAELRALFREQLQEWELATTNYRGLERVRVKKLAYSGFEIQVQYNPQRIISSSAKVDQQSILARPCFLCTDNRPREQRSLPIHNQFILLVNPYPVFPGHLTIPALLHEPQRILPNFNSMLEIARMLPSYTVFYNGPKCGASAPDHFHFQAVPRGNMPLESDFSAGRQVVSNGKKHGISMYTWHNYLRNMITFMGKEITSVERTFQEIYGFLALSPEADEPMLNILAGFVQENFIVHVIPRRMHRPDRYFIKGEKQLLLSPASIDLGGVLILPREEDFEKISPGDVSDVLQQVCADETVIRQCINQWREQP